ncbi:MAG: NAD(P)-dependent glycerol-3-phosphate dehydrogenase [Lewinellaceae bacterium]|nr:NAD(P)-dependent glycerol-3-phosphate dehydrogenase [Lewinella sp.]MCB9279810.1 NAD(P)-dependent glycerol-3-phosphate dehydrogenase [Lewinellaceae bacterium]
MSINVPVGVIGAGSFGTAIANLIAINRDVLIYSRKQDVVDAINLDHRRFEVEISQRVKATTDLEEISSRCQLIFPIVPSTNFRRMMQNLGPLLRPDHFLIHGTKGFDIKGLDENEAELNGLTRKNVSTMSEVITQESPVLRVGCLSGPNLAKEILEGQPTATLIASRFEEVIKAGKEVLSSRHFHVFGSHDILGAELAGALKNVIALGSGILKGKGLGKNIQAMLITRGLTEMIYFGAAMGTDTKAFFGTAGIGDLIATATSKNSRNFTFGFRLGQGEDKEQIEGSMPELAEGVKTLRVTRHLARHYKLRVPITEMLYRIVFEKYNIDKAIEFLMEYPYDVDVDFL